MKRREFFRVMTVLGGVTVLARGKAMMEQDKDRLEGWREGLRDWVPATLARPRLHFRAADLDAMRAKREAMPETWDAIRRGAERSLGAPRATHHDPALALRLDYSRANQMCFVGLLDEREDLIRDAWRFVEPGLGDEPLAVNWVMEAHLPLRVDLGFAGTSATLAAALDWAGDVWTRAQRERVEAELAARVALYYEIGTARSEWWTKATHNWRSVICGEMGVVALSIMERVPNLADVLDLSLTGIDVVLNTEGEDGSHSEGVGYWGYGIGQAAWFAYVLKQVSGGQIDLFTHPYLRVTGDYALYISTPDGLSFSYEDARPMAPNPWLSALLAAEYQNPAYQWLAQRNGPSKRIEAFLFTDTSLAPRPPEDRPTAHFFPAIQTATARSGWDADATFLGVHAGRTTVNHAHLDIGTFSLIGRGELLIGDAGSWPYDHGELFFNSRGPRWDYEATATIGHNTLLVNGEGQTYSPTANGEIIGHEFGEAADTFVVDVTKAYDGRVARFVRYMAFLKPDIVVLVDDIRADEPAHFAWLLHPEGDVALDDTRWTATKNDAVRLTIDILGFETFGRADGYRVILSDRETFYHDRVDTPVRRRNRVASFETLHPVSTWPVTAVLRITDAEAPDAARGRVQKSDQGATVHVPDGGGEWTVRCDFEARTIRVDVPGA